jgi:predicted nucleic acid-binding protein
MPSFEILGATLDLRRNIALVDTNVLVAYADNSDQYHEQASLFFESDADFQLLVAPPVVVETCAMLIRRRRDRRVALGLISWLLTPGNAIVFPTHHSPGEVSKALFDHSDWMRRFQIDYVDAYLMEMAHRLTTACELRPHIPIVTFDTGDYLKCSLKGYAFSLFDMRDFQLIEFN